MATLKTTLEQFQSATSRATLAVLLEIDHAMLTYLLYVKKDVQNYSTFSIAKKSGGLREINAPIKEIKSLQRRVADKLEQCISEIKQATGLHNKAAHGFVADKSILTNASMHRNKRYVLNLDLKDFFPTITGKRIRGFLISDNKFKFHPEVATTLAHIACLDGKLPQGSPCSPVFSNLIAGILDFHLARLAKNYGCTYTRYADDITFSTNKKEFPKAIAYVNEDSHEWNLGNQLLGLVKKSGFVVNDKKTRMQYKNSRQEVTGLVVNKKINVPTEYRHLVRAYVFSLVNRGYFTIRSTQKAEGVKEGEGKGTPEQLHGMLGFIHSVDNVFRADLKKHPYNYPGQQINEKKPTGNLSIYRRFLLFTRFYANSAPLIVGEGKTDGVYISNAAHQCKHLFPRLISTNSNGHAVLSFKLLKYARKHKKRHHVYMPNFSTATILGGGSGGGANLGNLIRAYHKDVGNFKAPRGPYPVIFIVDDDSGGKTVFNAIKDTLKIVVNPSDPFTRIFSNVYIVPIPSGGKKSSSIEDLFSPTDIAKGLGGKPFDFTKDADPKATSGKEEFAYQFVAKNAKNLDWSGFHPLLRNICGALGDYENLISSGKI